jgi:four helix bundle protein
LIKSYQDLEVWQLGMQVAENVYRLCDKLPTEARFSLADQMRRSSLSVPSNIAEGHARGSQPEFARFIDIALGSLAELESQIELAKRLNWLETTSTEKISSDVEQLGKMTRRLQQSVRRTLNN